MTNEFLEQIKKEISSRIALDFDGVIHLNSKGFHDGTIYDKPIPHSIESIKMLSKSFDIIIYSCKANPERPLINGKTGIELIWEWLEKYNIKQYIKDVTYIKPRAILYVDDKAVRFINWESALKDINIFQERNKNDVSKY